MIFDYPDARDHRRHGPGGYASYESYRPWLRDEFTFRCAYCLKRETWGQITGEFDIDHFQPQARFANLGAVYSNLVYSCRRCNGVKLDQDIADPFVVLTREQIETLPDGTVRGLTRAAMRLILELDLNSPRLVEWRILWLRITDLAAERDQELWLRLIGLPVDLPDLRRLRPPAGNTRAVGIAESWAALKREGKLPDRY